MPPVNKPTETELMPYPPAVQTYQVLSDCLGFLIPVLKDRKLVLEVRLHKKGMGAGDIGEWRRHFSHAIFTAHKDVTKSL